MENTLTTTTVSTPSVSIRRTAAAIVRWFGAQCAQSAPYLNTWAGCPYILPARTAR